MQWVRRVFIFIMRLRMLKWLQTAQAVFLYMAAQAAPSVSSLSLYESVCTEAAAAGGQLIVGLDARPLGSLPVYLHLLPLCQLPEATSSIERQTNESQLVTDGSLGTQKPSAQPNGR